MSVQLGRGLARLRRGWSLATSCAYDSRFASVHAQASGLSQVLLDDASSSKQLTAALAGALSESGFAKPQRRAEVLRVSCQLVEALKQSNGGLAAALGAADQLAQLQQAAATAVDASPSGAPKGVAAGLQRLAGLLGEPSTKAKGGSKAQGNEGGGIKALAKRKADQEPKQQQQQPVAAKKRAKKAAAP